MYTKPNKLSNQHAARQQYHWEMYGTLTQAGKGVRFMKKIKVIK